VRHREGRGNIAGLGTEAPRPRGPRRERNFKDSSKALALLFDFGVQRTRLTRRNSERLNPTRAVAKVRERYRLTSVMPFRMDYLPGRLQA
jgi:hypothetical protein